MKTAAALVTAAALTVAAPAATAAPAWSDDPVRVVHHPSPTPRVTDLRVGEHPRFDRVVVDLHGKMPGYRVRYVHRIVADGSGEPIPMRGRVFVSIVLHPAQAHRDNGTSTYHGPRRARYGQFTVLRSVAFAGDFEGYVSFGVGLRHRVPFRVTELPDPDGPDRLIVDFRHP